MRAAWALVLACAAEATVLLGADDARGAELGYRLRAALLVRALPPPAPPTPPAQGDLLLHFTLESPQLMLRGKQPGADFLPRPSLWDDHPSSEFLARWSAGRITETYLDSKDPPDVLNFKKALISLFQYQVEEGERNETDISGECEVQYEAVSPLTLRKFKHRCMWEGSWDADEEREADEDEDEERGGERGGEPPGRTERRRATRLELREDGQLEGAVADDLLLLRAPAAPPPPPALKARAHTALRRLPAPPAPPRPPPPPPPRCWPRWRRTRCRCAPRTTCPTTRRYLHSRPRRDRLDTE
ncbi:hypothetical protein MSG28_012912 [Choristoneura fumiferana]|uniref:Uncharacterized protein n=1 Tax=Choristoneura fumiferana TaxID=7141 RepID=A0ACC0KRY8_CHOFU|nr:hypothetical protein MSG28_012912 [Choristoneura fumiferana]